MHRGPQAARQRGALTTVKAEGSAWREKHDGVFHLGEELELSQLRLSPRGCAVTRHCSAASGSDTMSQSFPQQILQFIQELFSRVHLRMMPSLAARSRRGGCRGDLELVIPVIAPGQPTWSLHLEMKSWSFLRDLLKEHSSLYLPQMCSLHEPNHICFPISTNLLKFGGC